MTKKILIVDDEEDISTSLKTLLETMNYEIKTTNNGASALKLLKKENFDLVLLDILMPGLSGKETLEKIRADPELKNQKVAFLTVIDIKKYGSETIKQFKLVDYFKKPIDVTDFKKRIKKILKP